MEPQYRQFLVEGERVGARYAISTPPGSPMGMAGARLGRLTGSSLEFMDHREYQPGDDLRRIDWSAYARTDKLILKLYRQEVSPHLDILVDGSCSMALEETAKPRAALALAGLFAAASANSGYTHRAFLASDGCRAIANGNERPDAWEDIDFTGRTNLAAALDQLPPAWRPRSMRVLVSDLLFPSEPLTLLSRVAQGGRGAASLVVIQVLAASDVDPPPRGNLRLVDSETDAVREVFIDAVAETRYRQNLARHIENWHNACRQVGATFISVVAEKLVDRWDLEPLVMAEVLRVE